MGGGESIYKILRGAYPLACGGSVTMHYLFFFFFPLVMFEIRKIVRERKKIRRKIIFHGLNDMGNNIREK